MLLQNLQHHLNNYLNIVLNIHGLIYGIMFGLVAFQTLAVFTLWAITVYFVRARKPYLITLIPALFMTTVTVTYIMFAPEGLRLDYSLSVGIGAFASILLFGIFVKFLILQKQTKLATQQ